METGTVCLGGGQGRIGGDEGLNAPKTLRTTRNGFNMQVFNCFPAP